MINKKNPFKGSFYLDIFFNIKVIKKNTDDTSTIVADADVFI